MNFHDEFKILIHQYIKYVYRVTKNFPKEELFGVTSQLRRSAMSVMLNYIEGYAKRKGAGCAEFRQFLRTSYGSLKESEYLIYFSYTENYIQEDDYKKLSKSADRIGGILFGIINKNNQ